MPKFFPHLQASPQPAQSQTGQVLRGGICEDAGRGPQRRRAVRSHNQPGLSKTISLSNLYVFIFRLVNPLSLSPSLWILCADCGDRPDGSSDPGEPPHCAAQAQQGRLAAAGKRPDGYDDRRAPGCAGLPHARGWCEGPAPSFMEAGFIALKINSSSVAYMIILLLDGY